MTDETALAFGDLATRAGAGGCGTGADRLILRDYTRHGEIGLLLANMGQSRGCGLISWRRLRWRLTLTMMWIACFPMIP